MRSCHTILLLLLLSVTAMAQTTIFDFEGAAPTFEDFSNSVSTIIANPDVTAPNTSATVMQNVLPIAQGFAGIKITQTIDLAAGKSFTMKVWSPIENAPVLLKFEGGVDGAPNIERAVNFTGTANSWQELTFDFLTEGDNVYDFVVVFMNFNVNTNTAPITFYWDELVQIDVPAPEGDQMDLPVTFDDANVNYGVVGFEGGSGDIVAGPVDMANMVGQATKDMDSGTSAGVTVTSLPGGPAGFASPIPFTASATTMSVRVWSPTANIPVRLKVEDASNPGVSVETEAMVTVAAAWDTLVFDFSQQVMGTGALNLGSTYNKASIFFDFGSIPAATTDYYFDDMVFGDGGPASPVVGLPIDFESTELTYRFEGFEGADSAIETNPDQSGENTSATVMRTTKTDGAQFFAGTVLTLDTPIDFSTNEGISIKTWSPKVNIPIRMRLENADNSIGTEIDIRTKTASAWETLTADFGSRLVPGAQYTKIIIFFEFVNGLAGDGTTYYFDDIEVADVSGRTPVGLPIDFESDELFFDIAGFEGANANIIMNPDASGDNTSDMVLEYSKTNGSAFFAGVTVRFDTPIDFSTNSAISFSSWSPKANIPVRVQIAGPTAENIRQLDVNTTVASSWETLTVDFGGELVVGEPYDRVVFFYEFVVDLAGDGSVYYVDNVATSAGSGNGTPVALPVDFEDTDANYRFEGFEGADSAIETNPDQSGENTSATVMRTTKNAGQWFAGTFLDLDTPIDFSSDKGISISSWSPKADIPVRIQIEGPDGNVFVDVNTTVASQWETLTADFTNVAAPGATYNRVTVIFEAVVDLVGDGSTYYYDNIATADVGPGGPAVELPVDFESTELTYRFEGFEGADSAIETNPDQSGENTSATVMRTTKNAGQWFAGTFLDLDTPIDFSSDKGISISSWSPKADIPVRIQIEGPDGNVFVDVNTTVASQWETLTADFTGVAAPGATYNRVTVIFEAVVDLAGDGSTYYYDNIATADVGGTTGDPVVFPVGFENPNRNYRFGGFEGADSAIETNPDQSGENTSATIMRTTKTDGAQFFAGTSIELDAPIDLSNTGKIFFSSWSPKAGIPVRVQIEDAANTEANRVFVDVNTTVASTWETLEVDFSTLQVAGADYVRIVIFYEFVDGLAGDGTTYYFDNLSVDELTSTRTLTAEEVQVFPNPTADLWQISSPEARIETLEVFDLSGRQVLNASPNTNIYEIDARRLPTGTYIVRINTAEGRRIARLMKQ